MNYKTCDETIKSLHSNAGEVFILSGGRRMKLADCKLDIGHVSSATTIDIYSHL